MIHIVIIKRHPNGAVEQGIALAAVARRETQSHADQLGGEPAFAAIHRQQSDESRIAAATSASGSAALEPVHRTTVPTDRFTHADFQPARGGNTSALERSAAFVRAVDRCLPLRLTRTDGAHRGPARHARKSPYLAG
jgi:hypothetical protein